MSDSDVGSATPSLNTKLQWLIEGLRKEAAVSNEWRDPPYISLTTYAEAAEVLDHARALLEMLSRAVMLASKEFDGTPAIRMMDGKFYRTCDEDTADIVRAAYEVSRGQ